MKHYSLILLPTLECNVACDYCFERKSGDALSLDNLDILIEKTLDYLEERHIEHLTIYWQGGEVMVLPPEWYAAACERIQQRADAHQIGVRHCMQTNMIDYSERWNSVIFEIFGGNVGSSMDYPNRYRRKSGSSPEKYTRIWEQNVRLAHEAGIEVSTIAIPHQETLGAGAERFYNYFVEEVGLNSFQINTPFPGGEPNQVKRDLQMDQEQLSRFFIDLAHIWLERGYQQGVKLGPFYELLHYFQGDDACILCIWRENCADEFLCIDARGNVAQCDCWVTSYPDYWFGNIFTANSLSELIRTSPARQRFLKRPEHLIQHEDCLDCKYLTVCHGGCPIRTFTTYQDLLRKDPNCQLYKALFQCMEELAASRYSANVKPRGERALSASF
ncbi:radical SAM domain protein [Candidatus Moduliflexus flocculans]|uniref:Radical SAM domain protein n=1 Tax=Candidatus Moduliflexus flocculans TaxID=1499966 RepID=A0A0S6W435_9BACT|nr:radical SAM domain protein [Candidatus Moduliflexus flocculans]